MAHIQRLVSPLTKRVTWRVRWGRGLSEVFKSKSEATTKLASVMGKTASKLTLAELCDEFLDHMRGGSKERSTVEQYRQHIDHIKRDEIAGERLHQLQTPDVQRFLDRLPTSPALAVKIRITFNRIAVFGLQRGRLTVNPVAATHVERKTRGVVEVSVPPKEDLAKVLAAADPFELALVRTLLFAGLRLSEARGLTRANLDLTAGRVKVTQRADKWQQIGRPKSMASHRTIPLGPDTIKALKAWLLVAPKSTLVFPNGAGNVESHANLWNRTWIPLLKRAGVAHFGWHGLRHAYASMLIEQRVMPKKVSQLMGHASLKLTMDTYGHLWPSDTEDQAIALGLDTFISRTA
jgi:integrase